MPRIVRTAQKRVSRQKILKLGNELTSLFEWCQFCFELNTFIVVEVDVFTYEEARLLIGFEFGSVDTFGFKNGKEIFSHSIVIRISPT